MQIALTPSVSVSKTLTPSEVIIGGNVTVTITVTNSGEGVAANLIVSDPLPECLEWVSLLPAGKLLLLLLLLLLLRDH